jgi:multiple sugar transport system substrate-binding protein
VHSKTVTLVEWNNLSGPDGAGLQKIVNAFNSSQKGVVVDNETKPNGSYYNTLTIAMSGKTDTPQLFMADAADNVRYESQEVPFDKYIKGNAVLTAKEFPASLWKYYQDKGKQYEVPETVVPFMMYYNKSLLKKVGEKTPVLSPPSKVVSAAKKLQSKTHAYGMVFPEQWPMQFLWPSLLAQFGGKPFDAKTKTSLVNSKAAVDALTYLYDVIHKWKLGPTPYATDQDIKMLANGSAAQIFDGVWEWTNPSLATLGKNLGISPVPQWGPHYKVFIGDTGWALNKRNSSAADKAAVSFLAFYEKHSNDMAAVGDVPTYLPVLHKKGFASAYPASGAAAKELADGVFSVKFPGYDDSYLYNDALWPISQGTQPASDIKSDLDKAAAAITAHVRSSGG